MKFKYKVMLYMTAFLSFFYVVSACLLIFVSFQTSLNKEKSNALNTHRMIQNMLLVSKDMNQRAYQYTLNQLASQNASMWKGIRLKEAKNRILYYESGYMPYLLTQVYAARETQLQIYKAILAFVLTAGSIGALLISEKLTKPIRQLSETSRKIAGGNLSIRSNIHSGDEIELLYRDFNHMTDSLEDNIRKMADSIRRQEEFMGSFAHELKTPMTSIIGYADLMRSQALTKEEQQEAAEYIFSEGQRLESLSLKLLDLLVLKKRDFEFRPTNLQALIESAVRTTLPSMEGRQIRLKERSDEGLCLLEPDLTKSLIVNLIDNARKAIDNGGSILVTGRLTSEGCEITVTDTGRGMKKEELARITEAFYRVDKSRSRAQGGAGLGLALCQEIAQLHHGGLLFESTPGKGTIVKAILNGGSMK